MVVPRVGSVIQGWVNVSLLSCVPSILWRFSCVANCVIFALGPHFSFASINIIISVSFVFVLFIQVLRSCKNISEGSPSLPSDVISVYCWYQAVVVPTLSGFLLPTLYADTISIDFSDPLEYRWKDHLPYPHGSVPFWIMRPDHSLSLYISAPPGLRKLPTLLLLVATV